MKYSSGAVSTAPGRPSQDQQLAEVLRTLFRQLRRHLPLEVEGLGRVTADQLDVLNHLLAAPACTMGELAAARGIGLNSASAIVERLVIAGLVAREPVPADRRVVLVRLTAAGSEFIASLRRSREEALRRLLRQLDASELAAVQAALPALDRLALLASARESGT